MTERHVRLALIATSTAILLWMSRALIFGTVPTNGDLFTFYYPVRDFYARAIAAGHRFDWMPSLMGGFDLVGEGQLGAYHPLHLFLYRFVPLDTAFVIDVVWGYPFAFLGTWLFLRRWCGSTPALFGAMLFASCGFTLQHGVHPNMLAVVAHVPWLLWAIDAAFNAATWRARLRSCAAIALLTGSQLLLGHPQAVWLSGLIEAAFTLFLLINRTQRSAIAGGLAAVLVVGAKLLGVGVGAIQLMATMHAAVVSTRASFAADFPFTYALPPFQLLQLLHPYIFWGHVLRWTDLSAAGDEYGAYAGSVSLAMSVWWLFRYRQRQQAGQLTQMDRLALWAMVVGVFGWWMATGQSGRIYVLQTWLPFVGKFRDAVRYVSFGDFAVAVGAAAALSQLMSRTTLNESGRGRALAAPWILAILSALTAVIIVMRTESRDLEDVEQLLAVLLGPVLFALAAGLLTLSVRGVRGALTALVLFAAGDQAMYGLGGVAAWQDYATREQALTKAIGPAASLPPAADSRMICCQSPNLYALAGYRMVDGYLGLIPQRLLNYRLPETLRIAGVEFAHASFVNRTHLEAAEQMSPQWHRLAPPVPRARLLARTRVSARPDLDVKGLDVDRIALVNHEVPLPPGEPGMATLVRDDPGDIVVRTIALTQQLLTVSETVDAGWTASLDGTAVPLEHVNGDFLGCVVPPGEHVVRFAFAPAYRSVGGRISLASAVVAMMLAGAGAWPFRAKSSGARATHGHNG